MISMSDTLELSDSDFAEKMRGLIDEAERALTDRPAAPAKPAAAAEPASGADGTSAPVDLALAAKSSQSVPDMLRPLVQGVQAIGRTTGEHTQLLGKIDKCVDDAADDLRQLPQIVTDLKAILDQRNHVSRQMFDALHEELKTYKDGFLLDTVHRPMIRDLITLYDDLTVIHLQMQEALGMHPVPAASNPSPEALEVFQRLQSIEVHMEHNLHFVLEVLARLEVQLLPVGTGKLDKVTQRAVAVEMAESPETDLHVVRSVKRGFLWKERVVRAEEVVVKKWKEGFLVALAPASS
jgi:molecular chaperone GrpE (heat shock protein)